MTTIPVTQNTESYEQILMNCL